MTNFNPIAFAASFIRSAFQQENCRRVHSHKLHWESLENRELLILPPVPPPTIPVVETVVPPEPVVETVKLVQSDSDTNLIRQTSEKTLGNGDWYYEETVTYNYSSVSSEGSFWGGYAYAFTASFVDGTYESSSVLISADNYAADGTAFGVISEFYESSSQYSITGSGGAVTVKPVAAQRTITGLYFGSSDYRGKLVNSTDDTWTFAENYSQQQRTEITTFWFGTGDAQDVSVDFSYSTATSTLTTQGSYSYSFNDCVSSLFIGNRQTRPSNGNGTYYQGKYSEIYSVLESTESTESAAESYYVSQTETWSSFNGGGFVLDSAVGTACFTGSYTASDSQSAATHLVTRGTLQSNTIGGTEEHIVADHRTDTLESYDITYKWNVVNGTLSTDSNENFSAKITETTTRINEASYFNAASGGIWLPAEGSYRLITVETLKDIDETHKTHETENLAALTVDFNAQQNSEVVLAAKKLEPEEEYAAGEKDSVSAHNACGDDTWSGYFANVGKTLKGMVVTGPARLAAGTYNVVSNPIESIQNAYWGTGAVIYGVSTGIYNTGQAFYNDPALAAYNLTNSTWTGTVDTINYGLDNPENVGTAYFDTGFSVVSGKVLVSDTGVLKQVFSKADDVANVGKSLNKVDSPYFLDNLYITVGRNVYWQEVSELKNVVNSMKTAGKTEEEIARAVCQMRREIGIKYKKETPTAELEKYYKRNIELYDDPLGPTIDWFRKNNKSWDEIIESSYQIGGKDLGL